MNYVRLVDQGNALQMEEVRALTLISKRKSLQVNKANKMIIKINMGNKGKMMMINRMIDDDVNVEIDLPTAK